MMQQLDHHNRRRHHHHVFTLLMMAIMLTACVVRGEHPSPSKESHGHLSKRHRGGDTRAVVEGDGYISDWNREWVMIGNPNPGKCIDIPSNLTLCGNIGYDQMRIPNLLEHDTLKEVSQQASSWVRLLNVRCHQDTQVFLCSLFAPVCLDRPIWPCRSLCESVKAGCEDRMLKYGFPWPEMLRCNQFPAEDDLCIGLRNEAHRDGEATCSECLSDTFESTVDHYCRADFAMRIKVKQAIVIGSDMKIDAEKKKKIFKTGSLKSSDVRDSSLFIANGSGCDCPALDSGTGKGKNSSSFIVMGSLVNDRLVLSFVHRIDHKKSKEVNRALRVVRKPETCTKTVVLGAKSNGPAISATKTPTGTKAGNKSKGKKPSAGKGARKGASTTQEWKPTTLKNIATTPAVGRREQKAHGGRGRKQQKKGDTTATLFY